MSPPPLQKDVTLTLRQRLAAAAAGFAQLPRTFRLFLKVAPWGALVLGLLTLASALLPAALAWVGKLIIDAVVTAAQGGSAADRAKVLQFVAVELGLAVAMATVSRLTNLTRELLRARLGNAINEQILEKALVLELRHFEDADVYDKMQNARREASARPLNLVLQTFTIVQQVVTLASFAVLLIGLSPWSVAILVFASVPAFISEARLAGESFKLNSWRAPEGRKLNYLEWILTRDSHVKEVKLFGLGPLILGRYRALFSKFFAEDARLAVRRFSWGLGLGILSLGAFYLCYAMLAKRAAGGELTLGDMTLALALFRQGQTAFQSLLGGVSALYEDALFMSNLFAFLDLPTSEEKVDAAARTLPRGKSQSLELRNLSFRYPGKKDWALRDVNLRLEPGEKLGLVGENGAGKSTLLKLLLGLYTPTEGAILYGGVDVRELSPEDLRRRISAVFQDFVRYQFSVAENIGLGEVSLLGDRERIRTAADQGGATGLVETLPDGLDTMLGGWFEKGTELSGGQWQKLAVSRAFMRDAEVLLFDEPTANIDAEAEHALFLRFKQLAAERTAIIISHRFSTVRQADRICVLHDGKVVEFGTHPELLAKDGRYAHLFHLQARGYVD